MKEDELISKLVLMSFSCLWFIVLFTFGLLVYQTSSWQNSVNDLIKENARITSLWLEKEI